MKVLSQNQSFPGLKYLRNHVFMSGQSVPVYEVETMHALNRIIGWAKFNNGEQCDVYYRGECVLHDSLIPSLLRGPVRTQTRVSKLNTIINTLLSPQGCAKALNLGMNKTLNRYIVEGMIQHYGIKTRCIDMVDNHWVALWMGQFLAETVRMLNTYVHYSRRILPAFPEVADPSANTESLYQYILLMAFPNCVTQGYGVSFSNDNVIVDLRKALPSTFMRPHAQHGLVVRRTIELSNNALDYDVSNSVIGVLRIRIDLAASWIGDGHLLSQENLFPAPAYDYGYDLLLQLSNLTKMTSNKAGGVVYAPVIFPKGYEITRYF